VPPGAARLWLYPGATIKDTEIRILLLQAASACDEHWLTPKGHALLALVREGKSYAQALQIVSLAYDNQGEPRKAAMA